MCLAIPAKIVKIESHAATIDVDGVRREASLMLLEDLEIGDYVIVHAGFAIHKINADDALESLKLIRETASSMFGDQEEETDSD